MGLPIGSQTWPVRNMIGKDFDGTLKQLAADGFRAIELCSPPGYKAMGFGPLASMKGSEIKAKIEGAGLRIIAQRRTRVTREQAETFYAVHRERPFFRELVEFMTSGPVVVQVLEGENAIARYREIMGATDPAKAAPGTIRKIHAKSVGENSVHGSDAPETAQQEIAQFFSGNEIVG